MYSYERTWRKNPCGQANVKFLYSNERGNIHVEQKEHFTLIRGIAVFINVTFTYVHYFFTFISTYPRGPQELIVQKKMSFFLNDIV